MPSWELAVNAPLLLVCRALVSGLTVLFLKQCMLLFTLVYAAAVFKGLCCSLCSLLVTSALFVSFPTKEKNGLLYPCQLGLSEPT